MVTLFRFIAARTIWISQDLDCQLSVFMFIREEVEEHPGTFGRRRIKESFHNIKRKKH